MRIVMIHGSATFQDTIANLLGEQPGFEVIGRANSNNKGLQLVNKLEPDIVLVGFNDSSMDGVMMIRELKASSQRPKVIMLSQSNAPTNRVVAMSVGADGYVEAIDLHRELIPLVRRVAASN